MALLRHRLQLVFPLLLLLAGFLALEPQVRPAAADGSNMLVVSIGDSIASGEGAPDVQSSDLNQVKWQGFSAPQVSDPTTCHRSNQSGPAQAFNQMKTQFPNATFVSVACSGAGIINGVLNPQLNDDGTPKVNKSQLQQVKDWMTANSRDRIDVLLVSVGANDSGFGEAVVKCADYYALWAGADCNTDNNFTSGIASKLATLDSGVGGGRYDQLAAALQNKFPHAIGRTYLSQYHDPLHNTGGSVCNHAPQGDQLDRVSGGEAQWLFDNLFTPLNDKVLAATQRHASQGWTFVGGIAADFVSHAYCTEDRFANTDQDSQSKQGDHYGVVHPNFKGYQVFGQHIASTVLSTYRNVSVFVSQDVPASLNPGQQATVTVKMLNMGTLPWVASGATPYRLGAQNPQGTGDINTWGTRRVNLPADVPVGGTGVFTFTITAPATPGDYHFQWSMLQDYVEWFGEFTPDTLITVATPPAAPTNLTYTATPSGTRYKYTLNWKDHSSNETGFVIRYQDVNTTTWNTITLAPNTTTYVLGSGFLLNHTYNIYVQACINAACSAPTNTIVVEIDTTQ